MRLVIVKWYDSIAPAAHWSPPYSDANPPRCEIESVGWLVYQSDNWVCLAADHEPADLSTVGRQIAIPTPCVIAIIDVPMSKP